MDVGASCSPSRCAYRVFLSFRGTDTRKTFTSHLYTALMQAGIHTFRDEEEIQRGEEIKSELERGVKQSRAWIIVFSKDYASSRWCLDELAMILQHKSSTSGRNNVVMPLFYDVDPTDVRRQTGSIGEAFAKYEKEVKAEANDQRKDVLMENIKKWKAALKDAADLSGMELKTQANGDEAKFIQKIVKEIGHQLRRKVVDVDKHLVGMLWRTSDINTWIQDQSTDVSIMVISGMSGIGKTTIASYVFNENFGDFDASSFLRDVKRRSTEFKGLIGLQEQLLSDICKRKKQAVHSVDDGLNQIKDAICFKRILLVLDDVDHADQLTAISRMKDSFSPGSKIIVTTRNSNLLKHFGAYHEVKTDTLKVDTLTKYEAIKLFSFHAFQQGYPPDGYMAHTENIVSHCGGLPLALKVLGSSLFGKEIDVWEDQAKKLGTIPPNEIVEKLNISFDTLEDDDVKAIFLHIACFFVGEYKSLTVKILEACNFHAVVGIDHLVDRCLLEIDRSNRLRMHQLLTKMGRYIVKKESSRPGQRSRLHAPDSFRVLKEKTGTPTIKALACLYKHTRRIEEEAGWFLPIKRFALNFLSWFPRENTGRAPSDMEIDTDAFTRMSELEFLQLDNIDMRGSYREFPKRIRWLCWHGCDLKCVPDDLSLQFLVCLDMQYSNFKQVWKRSKDLPALKILNLSHCRRLVKSPDFSGLPKLEELILEGCTQLIEVCESIEIVERLVLLDLRDCERLSKLPRNLTYLEKLYIDGCSSLEELSMAVRNMESLKVLGADRIDMNALLCPNNKILICAYLPRFMVELGLGYCKLSNDSFPRDLSNLLSLKKLNLRGNLITSFPDCFGTLDKLEKLDLSNCDLLRSVSGLPRTLKQLVKAKNVETQIVDSYVLIEGEKGILCSGCPELEEIEGWLEITPLRNVQRRIIVALGLEELDLESDLFKDTKVKFEYGIYSSLLPGCVPPLRFTFKDTVTLTISDSNSNGGLRVAFVCGSGDCFDHLSLLHTGDIISVQQEHGGLLAAPPLWR